ncbi:MAG: hypothetical protein KA419_10620 [Acidobacteria bacterium]|nr:hypothetical protein [Acidobacteriota bacterium]
MACPKKKIILRASSRSFDPALAEHIRRCGPCGDLDREEAAMDRLFREHAPRHRPSPELWGRIESALAADAGRVTAFPSRPNRAFALQTAAALVLVLLSALLCVFTVREQQVREDRLILVAIDRHYHAAMHMVSPTGENPFQVQREVETGAAATEAENPFLAINQADPRIADGENPFENPWKMNETRR